MKVLCLTDDGIRKEFFEEAAKVFAPEVEVAIEPCGYTASLEILGKIEKQGPSSLPVPEAFRKHPDAEVVVGCIMCPISKEGMDVFPNLKVIGLTRGGIENIDMQAAKDRGLLVVNGLGRNAEAVSDYAMAMILSEVRNVARSHASVVSGGWATKFVSTPYCPHLRNKKVGLFGFGQIGRLMAQKLAGFKVDIMVYDPYVPEEAVKALGARVVDKDTLFKEADIVSVHARLTPATHHIIGEKELALMKPTAYFINTARSGLVDMDALLKRLQEHRLGGAALDVFDVEPLPQDSPWRKLDNCTMTTHIAGSVIESRAYAAELVLSAIAKAITGEVTPQVVTKDMVQDPAFRAWADGVRHLVR